MLVVNYNGNKPISNYYKYGVEGNNNADIVRFVVLKKQGRLDLQDNFLVYVNCDNDLGFVDKVQISSDDIVVEDNNIVVDWHLLKKHTTQESLNVSLCFENEDEIVWQTQLFTLKIMNGVVADDEIVNTYPTIIQDLQKQINALSGKDKEFVYFDQFTRCIVVKKDVRVLYSHKGNKTSKGQLLRGKDFYGKKYGNTLTTFSLQAGIYSMPDFLSRLCASNPNDMREFKMIEEYHDTGLWRLQREAYAQEESFGDNDRNIKCWVLYHPIINLNDIDNGMPLDSLIQYPLANSRYGKRYPKKIVVKFQNYVMGMWYSDDLQQYATYGKMMLKFVADFETYETEKGKIVWKGNMANNGLELFYCLYYNDDDILDQDRIEPKTSFIVRPIRF